MRRTLIAFAAASLFVAAPIAQQSGAQSAPTQAPKPDAKPAPSLTGKWTLVTTTQQGTIESLLDMKVEGTKVTGSLSSQMGTAAVAGEYTEGKLSFTISMDGGGGAIEIWFGGALKEDGTLAGTLDFGQGEVPWTAKRVVEKTEE